MRGGPGEVDGLGMVGRVGGSVIGMMCRSRGPGRGEVSERGVWR